MVNRRHSDEDKPALNKALNKAWNKAWNNAYQIQQEAINEIQAHEALYIRMPRPEGRCEHKRIIYQDCEVNHSVIMQFFILSDIINHEDFFHFIFLSCTELYSYEPPE